MNLSSIDLNLIYIVTVALEERSPTRAARKLALTQSAVSNALARARELFGDPLLVRAGRAMVPTPAAERLLPELVAVMSRLDSALNQKGHFDPATYSSELTLSCADGSQIADLPPITAALAKQMPRAPLRVVSIDYLLASGGLSAGEIDIAIGVRRPESGIQAVRLYKDPTVAVVRQGHPIVGEHLTREVLPQLGFITVHLALGRPGLGHAIVDQAFRAQGIERRIALTVPGFAAAAMVATTTDWVAMMPSRVAMAFTQYLPLRISRLPVPDLAHEMWLGWHERTHHDPAKSFARRVIIEALRGSPTLENNL